MMIHRALLFSGQGSQYVGMIRDIAEVFPQARTIIEEADEVFGSSLSAICFSGPDEVLRETRYTQPALFLHEAIIVSLLRTQCPEAIQCSAVAGHSLGEYGALFAAGVLDFRTALSLVSLRGELMFSAGEARPGTMAAIVGAEDAVVEELCHTITVNAGQGLVVVPANYNCPGQLVISGDAELLRQSLQQFKAQGAKIAKELQVSGAFHSPLMQPAQARLAEAIHAADFQDAIIPVYVNATAQPLTSASQLKSALIEQLVAPVRWTQSIRAMQASGIEEFVEIGPGTVLQGLVKRTVSGVSIRGIDTAIHIQAAIGL